MMAIKIYLVKKIMLNDEQWWLQVPGLEKLL